MASAPPHITLRLLGATELSRADRALDSFLAGPKRLGVVVYLALARPRGFQRRDTLLPLFWPERGQKNARNALSNMLYHIRSELGADVLTSRGAEEIGLNRERVRCDALAFEAALDAGDAERALALYRGDLLSGFHVPGAAPAFTQWLDGERERLRLRAAEGAWALAERAERAGDSVAAQAWAKKAAGLTPFADKAHTRLIKLLRRTGDRAGARSAYDAFAERLRNEWDLEPTDELQRLAQRMNAAGTSASPSTSPEAPNDQRTEASSESPPPDESRDPSPDPANDSSDESGNTPDEDAQLHESRPASANRWVALAGAMALVVLTAALGWAFWTSTPGSSDATVSTGSATAPPRSVAVLPFTYLGAADSTDYFSLGMTEAILTRLAQVSDLSVISRTSVMQYQHTEQSLRAIGAELGAGAIVEGSVQQAGGQVRITAQLIDARTDRHLWGASYHRQLEDVLAVQSEVATRIAEALEGRLLAPERGAPSPPSNVDPTAYHLYLRAQHLQDTRDPAGIVQSKALYEAAIRHDSSFALARGGLAMAYVRSALIGLMNPTAVQVTGLPSGTALPLALQAADRALMLDSTVAEAYVARALAYQFFGRQWDRSEAAFEQALRINPNHSEALQEYAHMHLRLGRLDRAHALMQRAVAVDPRSASAHTGLGYVYHCQRRYEAAIQELETALALDSGSPFTRKYLGHVYVTQAREFARAGRDSAAAERLRRAAGLAGALWTPDPSHLQILEHALAGRTKRVQTLLNGGYQGPRLWILLLMGPAEPTWNRVTNHAFLWGVFRDPLFDVVRDDPRFEQIVQRRLKRDADVASAM